MTMLVTFSWRVTRKLSAREASRVSTPDVDVTINLAGALPIVPVDEK
jgi:hypothetical protein